MGAARLASGKKPCSFTKYKGSQTALITRLAVSLCLNFRRGTRRPHKCLRLVLESVRMFTFYRTNN